MRLLLFLLIVFSPITLPAQETKPARDSVTLNIAETDSFPAYLVLRDNRTFEYWQMPFYSCWAMSTTRGTWRIEDGLLRLEFDEYTLDENNRPEIKPGAAFYRIDGNRLARKWLPGETRSWSQITAEKLQTDEDLTAFIAKYK